MSSDTSFTATGPAAAGFQTGTASIAVGARIAGNTVGGQFTVLTQGPYNAAVLASCDAYGKTLLAADCSQDARDGPLPRGVYAESGVEGGVGVEGNGAFQGVTGQVLGGTYCSGTLGFRLDDVTYIGVYGECLATAGFGLRGKGHVGVLGESTTGNAIVGYASDANFAALMTVHTGGGTGLWAESRDGQGNNGLAAHFQGSAAITRNLAVSGDVSVAGNITVAGDVMLFNRDLAERFPSVGQASPGTVMVIGDDGVLRPCDACYDTRVVGVVTGAGPLRPAITLGAHLQQAETSAIALVGTAYCLAEGPVVLGDLLVTSSTCGHAMASSDANRRGGAVLGKALGRLPAGERGLVAIVIALQ